jgi:hypothetical protein
VKACPAEIIATVDDGSPRARGTLCTQRRLGAAAGKGTSHRREVARTTLVETGYGVMTLGALVRSLRYEPDFASRTLAVAQSASRLGLDALADAILLAATAADPAADLKDIEETFFDLRAGSVAWGTGPFHRLPCRPTPDRPQLVHHMRSRKMRCIEQRVGPYWAARATRGWQQQQSVELARLHVRSRAGPQLCCSTSAGSMLRPSRR